MVFERENRKRMKGEQKKLHSHWNSTSEESFLFTKVLSMFRTKCFHSSKPNSCERYLCLLHSVLVRGAHTASSPHTVPAPSVASLACWERREHIARLELPVCAVHFATWTPRTRGYASRESNGMAPTTVYGACGCSPQYRVQCLCCSTLGIQLHSASADAQCDFHIWTRSTLCYGFGRPRVSLKLAIF